MFVPPLTHTDYVPHSLLDTGVLAMPEGPRGSLSKKRNEEVATP